MAKCLFDSKNDLQYITKKGHNIFESLLTNDYDTLDF